MSNKESDNQLEIDAGEYLRKHRIVELFEDLCSSICFKRPENVKQFIKEQLLLKQKNGFKTGIFDQQEIDNIFTLFDLKKVGVIDRETCKQALKTFASSQLQWSEVDEQNLPNKIDQQKFRELVNIFFFDFKPENHLRKHQGQKLEKEQVGQQCSNIFRDKNLNLRNGQLTQEELISHSLQIIKDGGYPQINNTILKECIENVGYTAIKQFEFQQFVTFVEYALKKVENYY